CSLRTQSGCCLLQRGESSTPCLQLRVEGVEAEERLVDSGAELLRRGIGAARRSATSGRRSCERGGRGPEREHGGESAELHGAGSPPSEHEGGPYSTPRPLCAGCRDSVWGSSWKLPHFGDGSPVRASGRLVTLHRL